VLSTEVFHESNEKFSDGIKKDEGVIKHYLRNLYMIVGMVGSVFAVMYIY
jgi:ribosomal protein S19